jgi:hypothetical protein
LFVLDPDPQSHGRAISPVAVAALPARTDRMIMGWREP